jgi:hypothetical protein
VPATAAYDITHWERDFDFPVFPQGARAKWAILSPADKFVYPLRQGHRYLFKYSLPRYPTEFWSEIVAYHIGAHLGIDVPPAYPAFDTVSGHTGALLEWFYQDKVERFIPGGDLFQRVIPGFDRKRGTQHNFITVMDIRDGLARIAEVDPAWNIRWSEMLFLDALTGNGDRHQDNWGIVVRGDEAQRRIVMAPAFDNGSSLGREYPDERLASFDSSRIQAYVERGRHHIKWRIGEARGQPHLAILLHLANVFPDCGTRLRALALSSIEPVVGAITRLSALNLSTPLCRERAAFMERLLRARLARLHLALT